MSIHEKSSGSRYIGIAMSLLTFAEGVVSLKTYLASPSMPRNAWMFGLSPVRFWLAAVLLLCLVILLIYTLGCLLRLSWAQKTTARLDEYLKQPDILYTLAAMLLYILAASLGIICLFNTHLTARLGMLVAVYRHLSPLIIWLALVSLQALLYLLPRYYPLFRRIKLQPTDTLLHYLRIWLMASLLGGAVFQGALYYFKLFRFYPFFYLYTAAAGLLIPLTWLKQHKQQKKWYGTISLSITAIVIFLTAVCLYYGTVLWVNNVHTPNKAYFHLLSEAVLHGRLYLVDPPYTHDLTLHEGKWFIPQPPLAAILMLPWVAAFGADSLNSVVFSFLFAAANLSLLFLILESLSSLGWIQLRRSDNLWLTILLGFGSVHWWVSVVGKMWFISQVLTVTFIALATLLTIKKCSPILVGTAFGLALLARPNAALTIFFLISITAQHIIEQEGRLNWKRWIRWMLSASIPIMISIFIMLAYNAARFDDIFDFGYTNENVASWLVHDLKTYGLFHPHFVRRNLSIMLLNAPRWHARCLINPTKYGFSIFYCTPALLYLVRSFRAKPFIIGSWLSMLLLLVPLALYYNSGAWQFGYKYFLDFCIPAIVLLAVAAREHMSIFFKILVVIGMGINYIGVLWWFGFWCI